jgi:hypothetical protein
MAVYDVDLPNGKTIQVQGPDDATDDELIAIARTHPSLGKQSAKPSVKTEAQPSGTGMTAGQLPAMSNPEQLLQEAKASTPGLKAAIPGAFTATQGTPAMPTAGGLYDLVSQGDIKGAWNALPESVRDVTQYGAPAAAGALALKQAYNLYQSGKEGEAPTGIKARTISGNAPMPTEAAPIPAAVATPAEPAFNPKEAKIAKEIENKYGYSWKDIKSNFGVSDVSITSPQEAEMMAGAYHQKQKAPTVEPTPVTPAAEVIAPVETTKAPELTSTEPATPPANAPKTGISPEIVAEQTTEVKKAKTKTPKPEYFEGFKKLPGTERQVLGTFGVAQDTERAKALVNALKSTLPEGAALEFPKTASGVSLGGMPNPQDVMSFTNKHLGTEMKLDAKGKFPADFSFTDENLSKMHQSILKELENAKTPEALAKAQKGMATLGALAGIAGTSLGALAAYSAYQHGKATGDWSDLGKLGIDTAALAGSKTLRAFGGIPYMAATYTGPAGETQDELTKLAAANRQAAQVGFGRGIAPPSPRSQVGRR